MSWREHFGDFEGRVWLNTAHQGALPLASARAAADAVEWKLSPRQLTAERFAHVPARVRELIGRLLDVPAEEVILANGASHGQHLWAEGLRLGHGDQVLLMASDFPSCRLPWLRLRREGVDVCDVTAAGPVPTVEEVEAAMTDATRVLALSWVHSFSGRRVDLEAMGALCRGRGVCFVVNTTQGFGNQPLSLKRLPVDAVTNAGWKWLCGPYGTGFCWMREEFRERLATRRAYWQAFQTAEDLAQTAERTEELDPDRAVGARRFDLFSPANFFQFHPWCAALELLNDVGLEAIAAHDALLATDLLTGVDGGAYQVLGGAPASHSPLVVLRPTRRPAAAIAQDLEREGIDIAVRQGAIRCSPHLYNSQGQVARTVERLNHFAG